MQLQALYDVSWKHVQEVAFSWIDRVSRMKFTKPPQVVTGIAVTFLLICKRFKLSPKDVLQVADNIIRRARSVEPMYVRAIDAYLKEELKDA